MLLAETCPDIFPKRNWFFFTSQSFALNLYIFVAFEYWIFEYLFEYWVFAVNVVSSNPCVNFSLFINMHRWAHINSKSNDIYTHTKVRQLKFWMQAIPIP